MSARSVVLEAVHAATADLGRTVTSAEVRTRIRPEQMPSHFDTALGSLVRTGELEAFPAREWAREPRRLYRATGTNIAVDRSVVTPSRSEIVHGAVCELFEAPEGNHGPVSSAAIRSYLKKSEQGRKLLAGPTLLPTALNVLAKGSEASPPLLRSIRIEGVRAQLWAPAEAHVNLARDVVEGGTVTDRVADLVVRGSSLSPDGLVSASDIAWLSRRFPKYRLGRGDIATLLSNTARPVSHRGGRQARAQPAIVQVGEIGGIALYAPAESNWHQCEAAATAFAWRQLAEVWSESKIEEEMKELGGLGPVSPWHAVRRVALAGQVAELAGSMSKLTGAPHSDASVEAKREELRLTIENAMTGLGGGGVRSMGASVPSRGAWLAPREAGDFLREAFGLTEDAPIIEAGFLAEEVRRIRLARLTRTNSKERRSRSESWGYDRVSLLLAGALRWADAEVGAMVALGASLLGHVRSFPEMAPLVGHPSVSLTELAAATAVLGDEAGRDFLQMVAAQEGASRAARQFAGRGLEFLEWIENGCVGRLWAA